MITRLPSGIGIVTALVTDTETQVCVWERVDGQLLSSHLLTVVHGVGHTGERRAAWIAPDGDDTAWKPTPREDVVDWNGTPHTSPNTHLHARLPRRRIDPWGVDDTQHRLLADRHAGGVAAAARTVALQIGIALWNTGSM